MRWVVWSCFFVSVVVTTECCTMLFQLLDALTRALDFMKLKATEINLDAVVAVRQVEEQLEAFLAYEPDAFRGIRHWLEVLRDRANQIADDGMRTVFQKDPDYAATVGFLMNKSKKLIWYPSRMTSVDVVEVPVSCSATDLAAGMATTCFGQISRKRNHPLLQCEVSPACIQLNTQKGQRDYDLTHQVFFWQFMESQNCLDQIPEYVRVQLCSNIMRDANRTAETLYPKSHEDLFMEQSMFFSNIANTFSADLLYDKGYNCLLKYKFVGFCGLWGFRDFSTHEWLKKILEWQKPIGCYTDPVPYHCYEDLKTNRMKREETMLSDGCLSHKTAVALLALVVSVRFEAENAFTKLPPIEEINELLN